MIHRLNILKMTILPNLMHGFSLIPTNMQAELVARPRIHNIRLRNKARGLTHPHCNIYINTVNEI